MLNLNGRCGPTGFALKILKMLEHFCLICVQLLMDEAAWVIWPEGKAIALKMLEHGRCLNMCVDWGEASDG